MGTPGKVKRKFRNTPGDSHYYTTSTDGREPNLVDDRVCQALADCISKAAAKHHFVVLAYVFMPHHIHLLIHPLDEIYSMELIAKAIKQGTSNKAKRNGWIPSDLWEVGGGYDRNVNSEKVRANAIRYIHRNPVSSELVETSFEYFWSSANWHLTGEQGAVKCRYFSSLFT